MENEGGEVSSVVCPDVSWTVGRVSERGVEEPGASEKEEEAR